jgi:DNA-binding NtrC family response regulator
MTAAPVQHLESPVPASSGDIKILLAADNVAARLTLKAVLEKSGYSVESAASASEAMEKIETKEYALVLCGLDGDSPTASRSVIKFAQRQEYRPATAYVRIFHDQAAPGEGDSGESAEVLVGTFEVAALLTQVAELLANRAAGRARRALRRALAAVR